MGRSQRRDECRGGKVIYGGSWSGRGLCGEEGGRTVTMGHGIPVMQVEMGCR